MGDPVTTTLVLGAGKEVVGGLAGRAEAQGEAMRAQANAYIGRTRAMQTNTVALKEREGDLGAARAVFGANQQRTNVSVLGILNEIRAESERTRRIAVGNEMSRAADYRLQASNARAAGNYALIGGFARAAPSLYDIYQRKGP